MHAKICGLSTPEAVEAAWRGGAAYIGFVFFARSPRNITLERASALASPAREAGAKIVAVTVDADDAELMNIKRVLRPSHIQLHGAETPARVAQVRRLTGVGVIKALRVSAPADLEQVDAFRDVADMLMFDAKPPPGADLPGGNGAAFDWRMVGGRSLERGFSRPWFLAGGLDGGNVAQAVAESGATLVDVSSGVESRPGCKDPRLIEAFLDAVRRA